MSGSEAPARVIDFTESRTLEWNVIIVAPLGLVLIILLVIIVVVIMSNADHPTEAEEIEGKRWAIAQSDLRVARDRYRMDPSEANRRVLDDAQGRLDAEQSPVEKPSTGGAPDPIDQIKRLAELRDLGIVSEEEFAQKKATLLQRLS